MAKLTGKGNISAEIIADSISEQGQRITTFVLEYHRYIHGEFMTHRMFSRNAASSRAIPVGKVIELVENSPATPVHWGKNQSGMCAKEECDNPLYTRSLLTFNEEADGEDKHVVYEQTQTYSREAWWVGSANMACHRAKRLSEAGYHKQIVNRLLEPFQMIRVVCTATEYANFFYLRNHPDAQPEIQELARLMQEAMEQSSPELLKDGEWHVPFVTTFRDNRGVLCYTAQENITDNDYVNLLSKEDAIKISASCCAQVSFRKADTSLEKALDIYARLVDSKPVHASPFEHQATPMSEDDVYSSYFWSEGITHSDRYGNLWSGNFKGWIQNRQLIPNNVFNGETK